MDPVVSFLKQEGPQLSTVVTAHLCNSLGISEVAARQRVSRAKLPVKKLGIITFPRNAKFLYLEDQFSSPQYWLRLNSVISKSNTSYGLALAALLARGGVCLEKHFPIICGAPIKQKKHLSADVILARLVEAKILKRYYKSGSNLISISQKDIDTDFYAENLFGRLAVESVLIESIQTWLKNLNLVSYNSIKTRDGDILPTVGTFAWDISGPTYLNPLIKAKRADGVSPGFWVCDVYLGRIRLGAANVFLHKCKTLRSLRNIAPTMHMIVADHYTPAAFQLLKREGVIVATVKTLFGAGTAEILKRTAIALAGSMHGPANAEEFSAVLRKLEEQQGEIGNIKGIFFEIIVRDVVQSNSSGNASVKTGFVARNKKDDEAEIDVLSFNPGHGIRFIETKAHNPDRFLNEKEIDRWVDHNIPTVFRFSQDHPEWKKEKITFELWSTAPLTKISINKVEEAKLKNLKRYDIFVKHKDEISSEFKNTKNRRLIDLLDTHFLKKNT